MDYIVSRTLEYKCHVLRLAAKPIVHPVAQTCSLDGERLGGMFGVLDLEL